MHADARSGTLNIAQGSWRVVEEMRGMQMHRTELDHPLRTYLLTFSMDRSTHIQKSNLKDWRRRRCAACASSFVRHAIPNCCACTAFRLPQERFWHCEMEVASVDRWADVQKTDLGVRLAPTAAVHAKMTPRAQACTLSTTSHVPDPIQPKYRTCAWIIIQWAELLERRQR